MSLNHSKLIAELELLVEDPFNYLYDYILEIKTKIDLENEQDALKGYDGLIKKINDFQSQQKKIIEANIEKIKAHYSARIEFSKNLNKWVEKNEELFKHEIETNSIILSDAIARFKSTIIFHREFSFDKFEFIDALVI